MATLSDTTRGTRRFFIGVGVFIILAISINICGGIIGKLTTVIDPITITTVDNKFGDLPLLTIPSLTLAEGSVPIFSLETQSGKLPIDLPKVSYVYKYKEPRQTLTSRDEAIELANLLGFSSDPVELNSTELKWLSANNRSLITDKITKSVLIEADFTKTNDAKTVKLFSSNQTTYESIVKSYGLSTGAFNDNYKYAKTSSNYLIYDENYKLRKSKSPDTTEVVLVNVYKRFQLDPSKIVTLENSQELDPSKLTEVLGVNPKLADTRAVMGTKTSQLYYLSSKNWFTEPEVKGIYSTINVSEAWNTVQSGKGSLVYLKKLDNDYINDDYLPLDVSNFYVLDITMKYYESANFQSYLISIYVFTGNARLKDGTNAEFIIYSPAVVMKES